MQVLVSFSSGITVGGARGDFFQSGPVLQSCASNKRYTSGYWSPSRPSVFFIAKQDGSVDIWDLLDRTHEPSMNQSITPAAITCLFPYPVTCK